MKNVFMILLFSLTCFASSTKSKSDFKNVIELNPLSPLSGISISYERLLTKKLAVRAEGAAFLWDISGQESQGFNIGLLAPIYRHRHQKHVGMHSPYISPFLRYEQSSAIVTSLDGNVSTKTLWKINNSLNIGLSGGRRWVYDSGFTMSFRAGYGLFVWFDDEWGEPESGDIFDSISDDDKDFYRLITKVVGGLELLFNVGFAF